MAYSYLLFDLDGTLTDSGRGIMNAAAYALQKLGIEEPEPSALRRFIGPPLSDSFARFYGMDGERSLEAVQLFREYYRPIGLFENAPFEGIHALLERFRTEGKRMAVATSKPMEMTEKVLDRFALGQYFDVVCAGTLDESRNKKWQIVSDAMEQLGATDSAQVLMIGDREQDVIGAHKNGVKCAGVLWGYGSREEFEGVNADFVVENYEELAEIVLK